MSGGGKGSGESGEGWGRPGDGGSVWSQGLSQASGWKDAIGNVAAASDDGGPKGIDDGAAGFGEGSVTETTHQSWLSRLGSAFTGILFGIILIPLACWLLFWNEGRAVHTARALSEGAASVVSVGADRPDPANEGRLVHVAGPLRTPGTLTDGDTGMRASGVAVLRRRVEMYQWREQSSSTTTTNLGGGQTTQTTYSYSRAWSDTAIDSSRFRQPDGRSNPRMPLTGHSVVAREGTLGGFAMAEPELRLLSAGQALAPSGALVPSIAGRPLRVTGQSIYVGQDPSSPAVGDLRITYTIAQPETASVIARQSGQGFAPYATGNGETLHLVSDGTRTAADMIQAAETENTVITWALRLAGVILILGGFSLILRPVRVLADVVPLLGRIAEFGIGMIAGTLTLILAPLVIAIAWLAYRPVWAVVVLVGGFAAAYGLSRLRRRRVPVAQPAH
ncbi:TMEM43 family protein [Plastoroseomonas hellenica]|uniref:TMEM43 family protein n=1 Tax=Plastoroseomonas hellenica TaxID=2687306 RepID=UPI001BAE215E|nr:TMEM43 family protein [Plastoroseomonas hellenica]MBR0642039.1 hypothetical protein [Plastoroseomonas hellenica]